MPNFRLSRRADADLIGIADYTIAAFGVEHTRRYRTGLKAAFRTLARNPSFGPQRRPVCSKVAPI